VFLAIFFGVGLVMVLWLTREVPELLVTSIISSESPG
jgi:hypothetical protein